MSKINPFLYEQMDSWLNRLERCPTKIINFSLLFISLVGGLSNQHQHLPSSSPSTLLYPVFLSAPLPRSINVLLFHTSWIYYFLLIFDFSFSMFEFFFGRFLFGISWDSFFFVFRGAVGVLQRKNTTWSNPSTPPQNESNCCRYE